MNIRFLPLLAATLLLAGCSSASSSDDRETQNFSTPSTPKPQPPEVITTQLSTEAAVGNQAGPNQTHGYVFGEARPKNGGPNEVREGATGMIVEARWSCTSPTCRFRLEIEDADDVTRVSILGDSPVRFKVPEGVRLLPGKWDVAVFPDGAAVQMQGEIRVSIFYGASIPEEYTAF